MRRTRWLFLLYPRIFRDRFAAGMEEAYAAEYARARARGRQAALRFVLTAALHAVWLGIAERLPRRSTIRTFISVDVRDAIRALWATPVVTAVGVLSLALGIGANTALFSILNSLVLRQLPVHEPARLAIVTGTDWTNPIWEQIRLRQHELFDSAFAWSSNQFDLAESGRIDPVAGAYVSGGMFATLGLEVLAGRPITPADDVRGGGADGHVVVISHRFWRQRFGGAPDVLGRRLVVNRIPFTIVGITPARFLGPEVGNAMDLFLPLSSEAAIRGAESALDQRAAWWLGIMVRLEPGQSVEAAAAALNAARPAIRDATVPLDWNADYRAGYLRDDFRITAAETGVSSLRNRFESPLTIIMTVVAAVLLIACANIANLMLARATARRHEMSVRLALGASRARLACQMLVESSILAAAGGLAGLAIARWAAPLLVHQLGSEISSVTLDLSIDWRVLAFTAAVALGATVLFGLAPALSVGETAPNDALKMESRTVTGDRRFGLRNVLVVAQVGLSVVLLAAAGLFVRTFTTLVTTPLGFDPERLLIVSVDAGRSGVAPEARVAFAQHVAEIAATAPGVSRASLSFMTPMSGRGWNNRVEVPGGPTLSSPREQMAWLNAISPGWLDTYGMRLLAGRDITAADVAGSEPVALVNEAFVRRFVGPQNPLGRQLKAAGLGRMPDAVVVGVVNDAIYRSVRAGMVPTIYLPMTQAGPMGSGFSITARWNTDRQSAERGLTEALNRADSRLAFSFRDYADQLRGTVVQERLVAMLSGFFGVLAMLLAALGLYGVTSYSVNRRRPEIAVRLALGAGAAGVVRMVLRRVTALLLCGSAIGIGLSLWAAKFVGSLLFRVEARDPIMIAGAAVVLLAVGLLAGWLPARQASRVDPVATLRA